MGVYWSVENNFLTEFLNKIVTNDPRNTLNWNKQTWEEFNKVCVLPLKNIIIFIIIIMMMMMIIIIIIIIITSDTGKSTLQLFYTIKSFEFKP